MPIIDTTANAVFNALAEQLKQKKNMVTAEEWNHMWNVLISQSNENARVLNQLKSFVAGEEVGIIELPNDYMSLIELIQNSAGSVLISSEDNPEDVNFYIKIET